MGIQTSPWMQKWRKSNIEELDSIMFISEDDGYLSWPDLNSIRTTGIYQDLGTILGKNHRGKFEFTNDKSYINEFSWN